MPVRIVEGQLPYTGGTGIEIDANKVISLLLREENNLIMVNDDNEVYTDLQLASGLTPSSTFPVGVTVGKVLQTDGRPQNGLILNWKTTSGDYARWIYANDGKLYFDKGDGTRNQVYYASEVDALFTALRAEIDELYMKWSDFHWVSSSAVNLTLSLSVDYTPTDDFIVNAPTTIEEGQTYILRVNNGNTVYSMVLGNGINNNQGANTSLTQNATDMFVFLAVNGELELQRDISVGGGGGGGGAGTLTLQRNGTTVGTFRADTDTTLNIAVPDVVDALNSTSTTKALSANQGMELKGLIDDLAGFGKFLSLWNATTGQPISFPLATPYTYSTGDYFVVEVVSSATPPVNYKPNGSSYTGTASNTPETDELEVGDVYVYDGSVWLLQSNHGKTVSFANIAGDPYDNTNLGNALGDKQDTLIAGTNITIAADGKTISATNTTYSSATTTTAGIVKLGNDTVFTDTIAAPGTTTGKTYPVQLNASGQMAVNVPRVNTTYTAGANVSINGSNVISATDTTYNAGTGITIGSIVKDTKGPCDDGYHIPTQAEWQALITAMTALGVSTSDLTDYQTYLNIPLDKGNYTYLWSSTGGTVDAWGGYGKALSVGTSTVFVDDNRNIALNPIRPFKDEPVTPDETWEIILYQSVISGIYHNATLGLISIVYGSDIITIADKNLGATTVREYGDSITNANCGNYFQWGNNYAFNGPDGPAPTTSSTQVDVTGYGPGNYYSSSTAITDVSSWFPTANTNLWGGATNGEQILSTGTEIINTGVLSVNGQTGNVTVTCGIQNDTTGTTTTVTAIRAGTEAEYALITPTSGVEYHVYPN